MLSSIAMKANGTQGCFINYKRILLSVHLEISYSLSICLYRISREGRVPPAWDFQLQGSVIAGDQVFVSGEVPVFQALSDSWHHIIRH